MLTGDFYSYKDSLNLGMMLCDRIAGRESVAELFDYKIHALRITEFFRKM